MLSGRLNQDDHAGDNPALSVVIADSELADLENEIAPLRCHHLSVRLALTCPPIN